MKPTTTVTLTFLEQEVLVGLLASVIRDLDAGDQLAIELTTIKLAVEGTPPDLAIAA